MCITTETQMQPTNKLVRVTKRCRPQWDETIVGLRTPKVRSPGAGEGVFIQRVQIGEGVCVWGRLVERESVWAGGCLC